MIIFAPEEAINSLMIKQTLFILLLYFVSNCLNLHASDKTQVNQLSPDLIHLYELAATNLNFSSIISEDSLINLSVKLESKAYQTVDYNNYFRIGQIKVNAYCLKGDIGLAISEAGILYERAKTLDSKQGMMLALQAIGNTYMHSEQPQQALVTFLEADKLSDNAKSAVLRMRLYFQIVHVCWVLNDMPKMNIYIEKLSDLLPQQVVISKEHYDFYFLCYKTLYSIGTKDVNAASQTLNRLYHLSSVPYYKRWYYWVSACYYSILDKDYTKALAFADSALVQTKQGGNLNEYRNGMFEKASLLEKMGEETKACNIYKEAQTLTDSLDMQRYIRQIEHLHATYLVDQLVVKNKEVDNALFTWIIISCTVVLLGGVFIFLMVRHKNKTLVFSRNKLLAVREETAQSIQAKSMFLSNMSHELRTPLNAIVGFSGILVNGEGVDAETKQQCGESIRQNADLLLKLVKDAMEFSELNIKEMKYTCNTCNTVNICRMVVDTVDKVKQTSATINFVTPLKELNLYTDSGRLQQVLINLLINATKFTKAGTITLHLTIDETKNEAVFAVEDTGCGIPLDKQPHVFERFEKLHEGVQGAGLGLSICQLIVEHFGGKIWIDAAYTEGARFVFTHPLPSSNSPAL